MTENIKNFLESEDGDGFKETYGIGQKLRYSIFFTVFAIIEIVLYCFSVKLLERRAELTDFIVAIVFLVADLGVLLFGAISDKHKFFYAYYGATTLISSCYLVFIGYRWAMYFLPVWFIWIPFLFWGCYSVLQLWELSVLIRWNSWRKPLEIDSKEKIARRKSFWMKVIVWVLYFVLEMVLGLIYAKVTLLDAAFSVHFGRIVLSYAISLMGLISGFGWKMILKQKYASQYWNELISESTPVDS